MSTGVRKLAIGALSPDVNNSLVIGVIIAKQGLRTFISKKDGEERGVWNFTLRDSPVDTINVTFWGSAEGASRTSEIFNIGDVGTVSEFRILSEIYGYLAINRPSLQLSPFQLQLQENSCSIAMYDGEDANGIRRLMSIPTKPPGDFLRLSDVLSYGQALKGDFVNLLVAVRNVGYVRAVKSRKDSRDISCRDILVMDQSHLEFQITLWTNEVIKRASYWRPQRTVIFFADVRLEYSEFRQSVVAVITSRTVITENPSTIEAQSLREYAENVPLQPIAVLDHLSQSVSEPFAINTLMTTAQITEKAWSSNDNSDNRFTALLYAVITSLDIDGCAENSISYKCSVCSQFLEGSDKCLNAGCLISTKGQFTLSTPIYDLKVNLTDHRGTLFNCRILSPVADEILNCPVFIVPL
ncbi:UNVERIFIED_CONTAM: hypothetical protein PYX00_005147 [Menopon gallinae]|uniref:Meiosis-specific with OB domain-containing protein n=1 Tax=Menopon gallinae TaxID=328185 RepID=A0AAW2HQ37_9NEOP